MSGYADLLALGAVFRPPSRPLPPQAWQSSPFSASWTTTVELLADELRHLGAERIVVELALTEGDLRIDGLPRANARLSSDAVRVAFDSSYGPLMYETGRYTRASWRGNLAGWQVNLRAIALGLEALRKVDRYGITKRGEQYTGWRQIGSGATGPEDSIVTPEQAWAVLTDAAGLPVDVSPLRDGISRDEVVRRAVKATHPDTGGDADEFRKVMRAKELLAG